MTGWLRLASAAGGVAASMVLLPVTTAVAQDTAATDQPARADRAGPDRILFTLSSARVSSQSGWLGKTPDRGVFVGAARAVWQVVGSERGTSASYFAELIPLAVVTRNPTTIEPLESCIQKHPDWDGRETIPVIEYFERCQTESASAYGVGFTPIGVSARFARGSGIALVTEAWFGGILFDKSVPYPNTTRFNYNLSAGTSLEIPLRGRSIVSIGYYAHHFSNGGRASFNPGILAHALQVGWGVRR